MSAAVGLAAHVLATAAEWRAAPARSMRTSVGLTAALLAFLLLAVLVSGLSPSYPLLALVLAHHALFALRKLPLPFGADAIHVSQLVRACTRV